MDELAEYDGRYVPGEKRATGRQVLTNIFASRPVRENLRKWLVDLLRIAVVGSCLLGIVSFVKWKQDSAEIRRIVASSIDENASPDEIVFRSRMFLRESVGYRPHDSYFLLPIFRFMRPTALQVIRQGGDCADRARAFIVILNLFHIQARKLALYDAHGHSVHAVAKVWTRRGPYYVDLLYNIAHEDEAGIPLSLSELANEDILRSSVQRAVGAGNTRAAEYPIKDYNFENVHTLNWEKSILTQAIFGLLVETIGEAKAKALPRPYLSEEPALMVIVLAAGASLFAMAVVVAIRPRKRERLVVGPHEGPIGERVRLPLGFQFGKLGKGRNDVCVDHPVSASQRNPDSVAHQP
jgi:hypothetical protein